MEAIENAVEVGVNAVDASKNQISVFPEVINYFKSTAFLNLNKNPKN